MRWLPLTLAAFASLLQSLHVAAQDDVQITKYRRFVQSSTAAPVAEASNSYRFSQSSDPDSASAGPRSR